MRTIMILSLVGITVTAGCVGGPKEIDQDAVRDVFAKNRVGSSPDYAVMKNATDHLITIHGYGNDLDVCMRLIEPYNRDASLSTLPGGYTCVPLNK